MSSIEDKIIAAISQLDAEQEDVETLGSVLTEMTRAQSTYLRVFPLLGMLGFLALGVFAAVQFWRAAEPQAWIGYATLFLSALIVIAIFKLWLYLVWVRNSIMREIKRMELRLLAQSVQKT